MTHKIVRALLTGVFGLALTWGLAADSIPRNCATMHPLVRLDATRPAMWKAVFRMIFSEGVVTSRR